MVSDYKEELCGKQLQVGRALWEAVTGSKECSASP